MPLRDLRPLGVLLAQLLLQVLLPRALHLLHRHGLERALIERRGLRGALLRDVVEPRRGFLLKRDLRVVVQPFGALRALHCLDARGFQLALLLQRRQTTRLLQLFLPRFALGFLALGVGEPRARLAEHLLLVLVHVHRVGARGLGLGVGVDLARAKPPRVIRGVVVLVPLRRGVQQLLVPLQALRGRPAHDGRDGAPLSGHELGEVQKFLILLPGPLRLLDARVQPLVPPRLALLRGLANQERGDARPLVLAVLHHRRLQDLILGVLPHAALDHDAHGGDGGSTAPSGAASTGWLLSTGTRRGVRERRARRLRPRLRVSRASACARRREISISESGRLFSSGFWRLRDCVFARPRTDRKRDISMSHRRWSAPTVSHFPETDGPEILRTRSGISCCRFRETARETVGRGATRPLVRARVRSNARNSGTSDGGRCTHFRRKLSRRRRRSRVSQVGETPRVVRVAPRICTPSLFARS